MKVLHLLWNGAIGGAERAVYQLVREQLRQPALQPGLAFALAGGLYWEEARRLGCPVLTFNLRADTQVWSLPRVARMMVGFDVHHFHSPDVTLMAASLLVPDVRRVYTHRAGRFHYTGRRALRYRLVGQMLKRGFHAVSGNTAHAARVAEELFHLPTGSIHTTYNGLEFDLLRPTQDRAVVRQQCQADADTVLIGTTANLRDWKRVHWLIEAVALMDRDNWRLVVIGDGPDRRRLEAQAAATTVADRIHFVGRQAQVANWVASLDIFVLPSTEAESFGNAVVEAMALGVPSLIMADSGGMLEHIQPGETGLVASNPADLAQRLTYLSDHPEERARLGAAGREAVRRKYTLDAMMQQYLQLYRAAGAPLASQQQPADASLLPPAPYAPSSLAGLDRGQRR